MVNPRYEHDAREEVSFTKLQVHNFIIQLINASA